MPEWLPLIATFAGTALLVAGGVVGSILTHKVAERANETAAVASAKTAENNLIDQLQEELSGYRQSNDARATEQDHRMRVLEESNAAITKERDTLRDYAHQLRSDIFDRKEPPPAEWPVGVFR